MFLGAILFFNFFLSYHITFTFILKFLLHLRSYWKNIMHLTLHTIVSHLNHLEPQEPRVCYLYVVITYVCVASCMSILSCVKWWSLEYCLLLLSRSTMYECNVIIMYGRIKCFTDEVMFIMHQFEMLSLIWVSLSCKLDTEQKISFWNSKNSEISIQEYWTRRGRSFVVFSLFLFWKYGPSSPWPKICGHTCNHWDLVWGLEVPSKSQQSP